MTGLIELHRHLDVSFRMGTVYEWATERGLIGSSTSLESFSEKLAIRAPMTDLGSTLAKFTYVQALYDRYDVMERLAFEAAEDCVREGIVSVEFRYSPGFVSQVSKLPWQEALDGIWDGLQRAQTSYPKLKTRLIGIISRDLGMDFAEKTLELILGNRDRFCALDLAGDESSRPYRDFEQLFGRARAEGVGITVHAGESSGPETVWEAIQILGAQRIGHGIGSIQDPHLLETLRNQKIGLEICPTSNWLTGCVRDFESHPLPKLLRAGVPVCINTDDPGIFCVTLPGELELARTRMGLSSAEIELTQSTAAQMCFPSPS